ncbi:MAG: metallophosphoesterase [Flavobacteriales bacterium]|nr:metallophosphoesterase [Flavobacteriales bacterium]
MKRIFQLAFILLLFSSSCEQINFQPNEVRFKDEDTNTNKKNIERVANLKIGPNDTLFVALISDTQLSENQLSTAVKAINRETRVDMVFHCGDITDAGTSKEFTWMKGLMDGLKAPYITVVGNHDCLGNGKENYKAVFGEFNFTFSVAGHKFIFFNTNTWEFENDEEYTAPDLDWLSKEVADSAGFQDTYVIAHVGPMHEEFGVVNAEQYHEIIKNNQVKLSIHGHGHRYKAGYLFGADVPYLCVDNVRDENYVFLKIFQDGSSHELIWY